MKSGRISTLLLTVLALGIGLAAVVLLQFQSNRRANVAEFESRLQLEADRQAAAQRPSEAVEAPTPAETSAASANSTTQRSEVDAKEIEVLVLDAANAPVIAAQIVLFRDQEILGESRTDTRGIARFASREGSAAYALALAGWDVLRGELELSTGRRTVTLPEASIIAGLVSVDGAAPPEPLELTWNQTPQKRLQDPVPPGVAERLNRQVTTVPAPRAITEAGGAFVFRGLPPEAAGLISWTGPYLIEGARSSSGGRRVNVPAPSRDLALRLVSGLSLRLRVVDSRAEPLAKASALVKRESKQGSSSSSTTNGYTTAADGRIEEVLSPERFDKLTVSVSEADGGGATAFEFTPPASMHGVWDLGDLATLATRPVAVLVQDTQAQPIAGAQCFAWPAAPRRGADRSDATGRMTIKVNQRDMQVAVEAFEYRSALFAAPADASEIVATLSRVCTLEFEVPGLSGNESQLSVEVSGAAPIFVDEDGDGPQSLRAIGGSMGSSSGDGTTSFECAAEKSGRWRISGLLPLQPLHAALKSGIKTVSEVEIAPLAQGEHRKVELRFDGVGKNVRVRVLAPDGTPQTRATVYVYNPGRSSRFQGNPVDKNGELELKSMYADSCTVLATAEGFAPQSVWLQPIPSELVEITLGTARSVELELVQRDGSPFLDRARISLRSNGPSLQRALQLGPGRYRIDGLPAGDVVLEASGSFGRMTRLHDTSVPFLRLVVGESGSLLVNVQFTERSAESRWQVSVVPQGATRNLTQEELEVDGSKSTNAWLSGLAPGTYEVWLEQCSDDRRGIWTRVGQPVSAVIDEQHMVVQLELKPPS